MNINLKYTTAILILITNFLMAQKDSIYEGLLNGLSKNYVSNYNKNSSLTDFLSCYNTDFKTFQKDKSLYDRSIYEFFNAKPKIIDFLLKYKNDDKHINHWVITENPCKSTIKLSKQLKNSQASIILIYNYLIFDGKYNIIINPEFLKSNDNVSLLIRFSEQNKEADVSILRSEWKKVEQNISK